MRLSIRDAACVAALALFFGCAGVDGPTSPTSNSSESLSASSSAQDTATVTRVGVSMLAAAYSTNRAPTISFSSPVNGATFASGTDVVFAATATDKEDGTLADSVYKWSSSRDGELHTGASFTTRTLSVGSHTITLAVRDRQGSSTSRTRNITITGVAAPENAAPSATIVTPAANASFTQGAAITFTGSATDAQSGALSGAALVWTSSINGQIGTGATVATSALSAGTHTITLTAKDPQNLAGTATRVITIAAAAAPVNTAPLATIVSPAANSSFTQGASITFTGSASDAESGLLSGTALVWTSSLNGPIGTGATVSTSALSVGTHTITLTAKDPQNAAGSATRVITISAAVVAPPPPTGSVEPAGMTMLTQRAFDCSANRCEGNWIFEGATSTSMKIVQDPTAPKSAGNVAQMDYLTSLPGGSGPANAEYDFPSTVQKKQIYVSTYFKLSSNFQSHPTSVNKLIHFFVGGSNKVYTQAWGDATATGPLTPAFGLQGLAAPYFDGRRTTAVSVDLMPNIATSARIIRGQWHHQELVLTANTPGVADGSVEMWLDGVKIMSYSGIMFVGSAGTGKWDALKWNPTWGGGGGTITAPFYMQTDDIYVSGK